MQEKINKERKERLLDRLLEAEHLRTLCPHNILRDQCVTCEEISNQEFEDFCQSPLMMETKLRRQLGIGRYVPVYVFLKFPPGCVPRLVKSYVRADHAATDVAAMRKDGFWAVDSGYLVNFSGDQIADITFANGDD